MPLVFVCVHKTPSLGLLNSVEVNAVDPLAGTHDVHGGQRAVLARLEALIKEASKRGTKMPNSAQEITPMEGVVIKAGRGSLSLCVKKSGVNADFAHWLEGNLAEIIKKSYAEFTDVNSGDDN